MFEFLEQNLLVTFGLLAYFSIGAVMATHYAKKYNRLNREHMELRTNFAGLLVLAKDSNRLTLSTIADARKYAETVEKMVKALERQHELDVEKIEKCKRLMRLAIGDADINSIYDRQVEIMPFSTESVFVTEPGIDPAKFRIEDNANVEGDANEKAD